MKNVCSISLAFLLSLVSFLSYAKTPHYKIAVFAPLYIDSAFNGNDYKLDNNSLPKYILPGLEFYNGVMMAIDSLQADGSSPVEVLIYDTKSKTESINTIIQKPEMSDVSLIIASFNNRAEIKPLADFALQKKVPLISSTYPNNGNIKNNPFFIIINSTLRTHCEEIYKYLQRYHSIGNLVFLTRKTKPAEIIQSIFGEMNRTTPSIPLNYTSVELTDTFSSREALQYLDSLKQNVVICGSLDPAFGLRLIKTLSDARNYPSIAVGMPTWDGLRGLDQPAYNGVDIVYSSPFYFPRTDKLTIALAQKYKLIANARPSDMMLKGFESMYHFTRLLLVYGNDLINHLSDKSYKLFDDFDIQAVKDKKNISNTDYLENKKLYFIKKSGGVIKSVN